MEPSQFNWANHTDIKAAAIIIKINFGREDNLKISSISPTIKNGNNSNI